MKKIGLLYGDENKFPTAVIERINQKKPKKIIAEPVKIDKVLQNAPSEYAVIIDRISKDIPFYRSFLKNAALNGTAVLNNPFWEVADDKFFNGALAEKLGIKSPKAVILPSHHRPPHTQADSFRNLDFPLDFPHIFDYVGFPAYFKPYKGNHRELVHRVENKEEFFKCYGETGKTVMILQEAISYDQYFRCYCLGQKDVYCMEFTPENGNIQRYSAQTDKAPSLLHKRIKELVLQLNESLGYDINTVEIAVKGKTLYPIDVYNPVPLADDSIIGAQNFEWLVEHTAQLAIQRAEAHQEEHSNLTWGKFITRSTKGKSVDKIHKAQKVIQKDLQDLNLKVDNSR
ncbi:hypothetical protein AAG747_17415 [Rapidithrix thailandica]|uniref:ATP-grasp domain-containing protein n=1 Tax=Rapidithrix thailandica TaxID=413964 RepID=A0AAW9S9L5_9BACT